MALHQLHDMAHDDDQLIDLMRGMPRDWEPPEYPSGLCFTVSKEDLVKAGGEGAEPDACMRFSAMGEVTSVYRGRQDCRVEIRFTQLAGEDGKFFELDEDEDLFPGYGPATICLCGPELEKLDLDADCERGDLIHLIGTVRVESTSSNEYGGDRASLQITELGYVEDESAEVREG